MKTLPKYAALLLLLSGFDSATMAGEPVDLSAQKVFVRENKILFSSLQKKPWKLPVSKNGWIYCGENNHQLRNVDWFRKGRSGNTLVQFNRELKTLGIELVVMPVPLRGFVYPEEFIPALKPGSDGLPPKLGSGGAHLLQFLNASNVATIDLLDTFRRNRFHKRGLLYATQNHHWSSIGIMVATKELAKLLKSRPWFARVPKCRFKEIWVREEPPNGEKMLKLKRLENPENYRPVKDWVVRKIPNFSRKTMGDKNSPILLIGDSFAGWLDHSMHQQLSLELGCRVDSVIQYGPPAGIKRLLRQKVNKDPQWFRRKKAVVYVYNSSRMDASGGGPFNIQSAMPKCAMGK